MLCWQIGDLPVTIKQDGYGGGENLSLHKRKKQLEKQEIDWSHELSVVRIHVERIISVLKQKYTILQGTLPINLISDDDNYDEAVIDKIVRVYCVCMHKHVSFCSTHRLI